MKKLVIALLVGLILSVSATVVLGGSVNSPDKKNREVILVTVTNHTIKGEYKGIRDGWVALSTAGSGSKRQLILIPTGSVDHMVFPKGEGMLDDWKATGN